MLRSGAPCGHRQQTLTPHMIPMPGHISETTHLIRDLESLKALYGQPSEGSLRKEVDHVHPHYRAFIEAAPFAVLATVSPDGIDASPRGDPAGFTVVADEKTLHMPDRRGNNRIDSLANIVADPRVAVLFLIPGVGETLRVNGRADISVDPSLLARFAVDGKLPRSVLVVHVETVYFQCSRAIVRSALWEEKSRMARGDLPSTGTILATLSKQAIDGDSYDRTQEERVKATLY